MNCLIIWQRVVQFTRSSLTMINGVGRFLTKYTFGYFGLIRGESSARHLRKCPAISCCPVQQAVVVGCDITRSRGSIPLLKTHLFSQFDKLKAAINKYTQII